MTREDNPGYHVRHFQGELPSIVACPGGLSAPEQVSIFAVEGYSLGDKGWEKSDRFLGGKTPGLVANLDEAVAQKAFNQLNIYLSGRRAAKEMGNEDREGVVAIWPEVDGKRLLMILDAGNDNDFLPLHEAWEEIARTSGFGAYEEGLVVAHHRLDANIHLDNAFSPADPPPPSRSPSP